MSETAFKKETEAGILKTGTLAHFSYIESPETSPGIPDANIAFPGIEVFIEFKFEDEPYKTPEIRPSQVRWFRKRAALNSQSFLFAKVFADTWLYLLIPGINVETLIEYKSMNDWQGLSYCMWYKEMNWHEFVSMITRGQQ